MRGSMLYWRPANSGDLSDSAFSWRYQTLQRTLRYSTSGPVFGIRGKTLTMNLSGQQDHGARQQPIFQYIRDFDNSTRKLVSLPLGCPGYTYEHILLACHLIAETRPLECVPNQDIFISPMFPSTTCSVAQLLSSIGRLGRTLYGNISHADGSQMASTSSSHLRNEVLVPKGGRSDVA